MAESTPIWRRDFPYEAAGEDEVTRRPSSPVTWSPAQAP